MNLPQVLFRFRPWSVLKIGESERKSIAEIEGRFAYFSSPLAFNDPQDSLLGPEFSGGRGDIDRWTLHGLGNFLHLARKTGCLTELDSNDPVVQAEVRQRERRENRTNSRVCCFSWDWSSPLLWTFYAQDHQGFCLGYGTDGDLLRRARPVIYTHPLMSSIWKTRRPTMTNYLCVNQPNGNSRRNGASASRNLSRNGLT
jgi:hypothetical protein